MIVIVNNSKHNDDSLTVHKRDFEELSGRGQF